MRYCTLYFINEEPLLFPIKYAHMTAANVSSKMHKISPTRRYFSNSFRYAAGYNFPAHTAILKAAYLVRAVLSEFLLLEYRSRQEYVIQTHILQNIKRNKTRKNIGTNHKIFEIIKFLSRSTVPDHAHIVSNEILAFIT